MGCNFDYTLFISYNSTIIQQRYETSILTPGSLPVWYRLCECPDHDKQLFNDWHNNKLLVHVARYNGQHEFDEQHIAIKYNVE